MTIEAVLFDADGVIQLPTVDWQAALESSVPAGRPAGEFVLDLMASEAPSVAGKADFREAVAEVLARWNVTTPLEQVLGLWQRFEADPDAIALVQELRATGVGCHLATNQQAYRRAIMNDQRNYGAWFDRSFYSCDLGVAKPDPAYFKTIVAAIDLPPTAVLFVDDNQANVDGAREAGLHAEQFHLSSGLPELRELLQSYGLLS
ncbi:HAD-superfamily hydrolase, subfamily IA, variant 3 [Kribbella flavida DSM 17836]|uniref:HAD-superfamily hydrolase, subfamily IA, variant 3 n=1 Tax=Kribbella flavida (strain DSM 17836 / JCM 10339 / NBRC 14399) TaxID=479435 RepID=D2Q0N5_KRIFD|nr:HAD-IA family hydrolase [Kribbella flavida]ADB33835.1 HAD-superfamily hydrolase, subfamily IA, variant 3 [Kribbella flavida DSM 17836]